MKISIKREQSQAGLSFAEREKFRPQVKNKLLLLLALLMTAATGARAAWTGGTYTATANENLGAITVNGDATLTINSDVTVTITGGINVASGTLTVTGPGTLVVTGAKGNNGASGWEGSNGSNGGVAISGNIIVQGGATVTATGGTGGNGGTGAFVAGTGGNGGVAFAGTLTYKSGTVTANGGSAGSGGYIDDEERYASSGSAGKAFANDVDFTQTTGYSVTNGTSTIGSVLNQTKVVISGGTDPAAPAGYTVTMKDGVKDADKWTVKVGEGQAQALPIGGLKGDGSETVTLQYNGRLKVKGVKATSEAAPAEEPVTLGTPLTIEAITAGTIIVNMNATLQTGMKYSVNGGTKTTITSTTSIEGLKAGDKVQFYGNGTQTQVYGDTPEVEIKGEGDGFKTKVYGNIMSLLDEEGFATKTDLPNAEYVFYGLFWENSTLIDASELLLPAKTLADCCYRQMFKGCTSLTTAPKLPATTLAKQCYYSMFDSCTSLTSAYVKATYTGGNGECTNMFKDCTATGAVLHTTSDNKASWEAKMGTGKTWENWTVADDWQE